MRSQLIILGAIWAVAFAVSASFFTLELALAISLGTAALVAALLQLRTVRGETLEDLSVASSDGLRPQIASTASSFRKREMPGALQIRIAAATETYIRQHHLDVDQRRARFGANIDALLINPDRMSDSQARDILAALRKDSSHD